MSLEISKLDCVLWYLIKVFWIWAVRTKANSRYEAYFH